MQYPLKEKIGTPDTLVGRKKEFAIFEKWIAGIPKEISKSRVILARRKSGKTSFVQRLFNKLWSENGKVIPFYFDIADSKIWLANLAQSYFRTFASQYISFLERDPGLVENHLRSEEIKEYGAKKNIPYLSRCVQELEENMEQRNGALMWETAVTAPHKLAALMDQRFLVILDEFQNISSFVCPDEEMKCPVIETLAGTYHSLSESKVAPMLVTGSYPKWLITIMDQYLEAGRLSRIRMNPYLTQEEGLQAVYRYSELYSEPVTNETAVLINKLCYSDPFFISCIFQSIFDEKNLTTEEGVAATVNYEITDRQSEMSMTWREYIDTTLTQLNDRHAKQILLYLSKHNDRFWRPGEIKKELNLELSEEDILRKLITLAEADFLERGTSGIQFKGLTDGTLNMVLRNRFEEEISGFVPDLKKEFHQEIAKLKKDKRRLQGILNNLAGKVAEIQLATSFRSRKRFPLSEYFMGIENKEPVNIISVSTRVIIQREDGRNLELDVLVESSCGTLIAVEVKKREVKTGKNVVEDFIEKTALLKKAKPEKIIVPCVLSLGGFTEEALELCREKGIGFSEVIRIY